MTGAAAEAGSAALPERPYATLAPYFARLFEPRGVRRWFKAAHGLVTAAGVVGGLHLDVGAGTCRYSRYWTLAGFRTVCVDLLHQMLVRARVRGIERQLHRVCGTVDCVRPTGLVDLATAIDDVVAYVGAQPGGLDDFLDRLGPRIRRGGLFLFDFITPDGRSRYTFRNSRALPEGRIVADSRGQFDEAGRVLRVDLTLTAPDHVAHELHVLRLYTVDEIRTTLQRHGFDVVAVTDLYDGDGTAYEAGLASYDLLARRR